MICYARSSKTCIKHKNKSMQMHFYKWDSHKHITIIIFSKIIYPSRDTLCPVFTLTLGAKWHTYKAICHFAPIGYMSLCPNMPTAAKLNLDKILYCFFYLFSGILEYLYTCLYLPSIMWYAPKISTNIMITNLPQIFNQHAQFSIFANNIKFGGQI